MHKYYCERCGKEKEAKYRSQIKRFCSHKCSNYGKSKGEKTNRTCINCNVTFELLKSQAVQREKTGDIKFCSKKCEGVHRTYLKEIPCPNCKGLFKPASKYSKYCSRSCSEEYIIANNLRKKNGYWYENGYKVLYIGEGKGIKEHIKVMEDYLGRKLNCNEVVHHKNEDKLDNRIENLEVMDRGEHSRLHRNREINQGKNLFGK